MNKNIFWLVIIIILVAGGFYFYQRHPANTGQACPTDALICPDGTAVGRTGPNCSFAPCPTATSTSSDTSGWKTQNDATTSVTFKYPADFGTTFIGTVDWPPAVQVLNDAFACSEGGSATMRAGETKKKTINGTDYCVTTETEGAAGSIYTTYAYAKGVNGKTVILTFSTRTPQCMNYPDPQQTQCKQEVDSFNLDSIVDRIFGTLSIAK